MMGGYCIGLARYPYWTCMIRPFWDRLDIQVPYVFYQCTPVFKFLPFGTVFTPRFWEEREHEYNTGVGIVPGTTRVLRAAPDVPPIDTLVATPTQLLEGFSFDDYTNGRLPVSQCISIPTICNTVGANTPGSVYLTATGWVHIVDNIYDYRNGCFRARQTDPCVWESEELSDSEFGPFTRYRVTVGVTNVIVSVGFGAPTDVTTWKWIGQWDGREELTLDLDTTTLPVAWVPPQVALSFKPCGGQDVSPTGMLQHYLGSRPPPGWVFCDGQDYPTSAPYDKLFNLIGNDYDTSRGQAAPGAGRFRVPLLDGLALSAAGRAHAAAPPAPATFANAPGDYAGAEEAAIVGSQLPAHSHPITDPGHTHGLTDPGHTHGVTDPGHSHAMGDGYAPLTSNNAAGQSVAGGVDLGDPSVISAAATGVAINSAVTGATASSAITGITTTGPVGFGDPIDRKQPTTYYYLCVKL